MSESNQMTAYVDRQIRNDLLRVTQNVGQTNLVTGTQGNLSARDPATGYIAITPHDRAYETLDVGDLVVVDEHGRPLAGRHAPSYDTIVHCAVYRARPDVGAVIHTEPTYVNVFGVLGRPIPPTTTAGLKSAGGPVPIMPFRPARDEAFAREMIELMGPLYAVVWAHHGLFVVGSTIEQAFARSTAIEFNAQVAHLAGQAGEPRTLTWSGDGRMGLG